MRNDLEEPGPDMPAASPDVSAPAPDPSDGGAGTGPRLVRIVLLAVTVLLGLLALVNQLLAVMPVGWISPVLHVTWLQAVVLVIGGVRDTVGVWNIVLAALALTTAVYALRRSGARRRTARTFVVVGGVGLALALLTTTVQILAVHGATGRWFPFAPTTLTAELGRGPDKTVTYATLDGEKMKADLYLPDHASAASAAPLVVSIHGGGFVQGSRGRTPYTSWLADRGYVVLDVDYRLSTATEHRWNTQDADVACAMTWATAHADEYHWDLDRVATFGGSAGGNLAINVAYKIDAGTMKPSCGTAAELPRVKAVIASFPAVDVTAGESDSALGHQVGQWHIGGTPAQHPDRYRATDSATHITGSAPPTLILHGGADHLVFAGHSKAFADKLTAAGITHRYVQLPFMEHGYGGSVATIGMQTTRALALPWLRDHLRG
ncbi:alpha/beta hydrolase [Streptomyces sp. V2]|uniref:Alpha/beta hydrolase fold domain-containing protein n=1 Tax=Streptomyces niveiscabiei TaxID=164115 RepID=A0ABW9HPD6_9ACTN|nr:MULTISPECIES: alpha/beta hydrolase [Streptomyces]PWG15082.1 alpha/beta hydrolase [Streptomyces sp. V2]